MTPPAFTLRRILLVGGLLAALVCAGALTVYAAGGLRRPVPSVGVKANPPVRTIRPGMSRYVGLRVTRRHFSGPVVVVLLGHTPRGIVVTANGQRTGRRCRYRSSGRTGCTFRLVKSRTRVRLYIAVARSTRSGTYRLRVRAARPSGKVRKTIIVRVIVPGVSVVSGASTGPDPATLVVQPSRRTVPAGTSAAFPVGVERNDPRQDVTLRVITPLPPGVVATVNPRPVTGGSATVTFTTDNAITPDGTYPIQIEATSAGGTSILTVTLVVDTPPGMPFPVSGDVGGLAPGITKPIDLTLTNPNAFSITVMRVGVTVGEVSGPNITADRPCSADDFTLEQATDGIFPLVVPPGPHTLTELGVAADRRPQLTLVDRPVNQDGCKGATEKLTYDGMAQRTP